MTVDEMFVLEMNPEFQTASREIRNAMDSISSVRKNFKMDHESSQILRKAWGVLNEIEHRDVLLFRQNNE